MKSVQIFFVPVLMALGLTGCSGNDRAKSDPAPPVDNISSAATTNSNGVERPLTSFSSVDLQTACYVSIKKGGTFKAVLDGPENLVQHIVLVTEGNTLLIKTDRENDRADYSSVRITLYSGGLLNGLAVSGSGSLMLDDPFTDINSVAISGSGNINAAAHAQGNNLVVSIAGSGKINLFNMEADAVTCNISGSGDASVNVSKRLTASISGSGNIYYKGSPAIQQNISGSGKLVQQ
jgi:Putative auto-transporter adhesin, head GIN domain